MAPSMRLLTFVSLLACSVSTAFAQQKPDLTTLLTNNTNLTEFTSLIRNQYSDIYANLSFQQDITILVPSNDAFAKIPYSSLGDAFINNSSDIIRSVLQYHVLLGLHPKNSFNGSFSFVPTWLDNSTYTNVTGGQVVAGVQQSGEVNVWVSGMGSRSTMTLADQAWEGGLVHVIDTFLMPPENFINTVPQFNLTAVGGAVANATLTDYVDNETDLTIFAPNNDAFQAIGTDLSTMTASQLANLLDYHIVNGSNFVGYSANLPNGTRLQTRQGGKLTIIFDSNSIFVNSARLVQQDILIANGVLHVIDNFLDPNATDALPAPSLATQPPQLTGTALSGNIVPFVTDLPSSVTSFSSGTPTPGAASSFGLSDIGQGAASSTYSISTSATSTSKKSSGDRLESQSPVVGAILGAMVWILGFL